MSASYEIPTDIRPKDATAAQKDGFHGLITADGPHPPKAGRYHLYLGHFCPYAHRAAIIRYVKGLEDIIDISVVKAAGKGDETGWPGWRFPIDDNEQKGATVDHLFGSKFFHEIYFKARPDYAGRFVVPALWDKEVGTIVSSESLDIVRNLNTAFNDILPEEFAKIDVRPEALIPKTDALNPIVLAVGGGVFRAGAATEQSAFEAAVGGLYAALNRLESIISQNGGPFLLGKDFTESDILFYVIAIRFELLSAHMARYGLGLLRDTYPWLDNWLRNLYWNVRGFKETTDFDHIRQSFVYSNPKMNPHGIIPLGPYPNVKEGVEDWKSLKVGKVTHPLVLEAEKKLPSSHL